MTRELVRHEGLFVRRLGRRGGGRRDQVRRADRAQEENILVLLPDGAQKYLSKIFNDEWMRENGFLDEPDPLGTVRDLLRAKQQRPLVTARKGRGRARRDRADEASTASRRCRCSGGGARLVGHRRRGRPAQPPGQGRGRARHADRRPGRDRLRDGDAGDARSSCCATSSTTPRWSCVEERDDDRRRHHQDRSHRVPGRAQGAMKREAAREARGRRRAAALRDRRRSRRASIPEPVDRRGR